ncbi:MAG: TMEM165/GDT1 family protein [Candidatus Omnitrophica bacterium]|nr:TMEM165/GDT1 family protein [Candidatus Omnitrophota bacterium]
MPFKIFLSIFSAVFFAEMGDKTQLAGLSLVSRTKSPWLVFLGSVSAYTIVTLFTVCFGHLLGRYLPENFIRFVSASIFIIIGIFMLLGKV